MSRATIIVSGPEVRMMVAGGNVIHSTHSDTSCFMRAGCLGDNVWHGRDVKE